MTEKRDTLITGRVNCNDTKRNIVHGNIVYESPTPRIDMDKVHPRTQQGNTSVRMLNRQRSR